MFTNTENENRRREADALAKASMLAGMAKRSPLADAADKRNATDESARRGFIESLRYSGVAASRLG